MMATSSFEEVLGRDGRLVYYNVGDSMMPLIRPGRDLLVIEGCDGGLRRLDVALYRRDSGQYVLHRVLRVRRDGYVICGDNRWRLEFGITDRHVIGRLASVVRDGVELEMSDWRCRLYAHIICDLFPVRSLVLRARDGLRALARRCGRA